MKIGYFPETVNNNVSRITAGFVATLALITIYFESSILVGILLAGFILRFLFGSKYDPFASIACRFIVPTFNIKPDTYPGKPKQFAQFIGLLFSTTALALILFGKIFEFQITLGTLAFFAFLESVFGFCAGCLMYSYLVKFKIIPGDECEKCESFGDYI